MGARLIAKNVDSEQYALEYAAPVRRGLEGVYFTNVSVDKAAHNYAPNKLSVAAVGLPVPFPSYTTMKGLANYIQTPILETAEQTMLVICKAAGILNSDPEHQALFCGSYQVGVLTGASMFSSNAGFIGTNAGFGNDDASNANLNATVVADTTNWGLYSATIKEGSISIKNHTSGAVTTTTTGLPRRPGGRTLRIGSGYATSFKSLCDIAAWQCHSVAMTADELAKTAADLKAYALRKGISV